MNELIFVFTPLIFSFILAYLSTHIKGAEEGIGGLQIIFLAAALFVGLSAFPIGISMAKEGLSAPLNSTVSGMMTASYKGSFWFVFAIITIVIVFVILKYLGIIGNPEKAWDRKEHEYN